MKIKNVFKNISHATRAFWNTVTHTPYDIQAGWSGIDWGNKIAVDQAKRCSTVFSCTRLLSDTIAQLPLNLNKIEENGDSYPAKADPLYSALKWSPNAWQTAFDYWKWNMDCMLYRGWFISLILRSGNGKVVGLLPLHPDSVTIRQDPVSKTLVFSGESTIGPNGVIKLENVKQDQAFFSMYATSDGITPVSPITYNAETINLSLNATEHGSSFLKNDQTPPIVIQYPHRVDKEGLKLLAASWANKSGGKNAGTPRVVEQGATIQKLSISNQDAQYLELRQFEKEEICGIFGVPTHMISDTKQAKGWSTVEMQGIEFVTYSINPYAIRIEQSIRKLLIPRGEWGRKEAKFNTNALMRGDSKARVEYYNKMKLLGAISANEIRSKEDFNLRTDEGGDEYWIPANILVDDGTNTKEQTTEDNNEQTN